MLMFYGTYFLDLRGFRLTLVPALDNCDDSEFEPSDEYPYHKSSAGKID